MASKRQLKKNKKNELKKRFKISDKEIKRINYQELIEKEKRADKQKIKRERQKEKTRAIREKKQIEKQIAKEKLKIEKKKSKESSFRKEVYRLVSMANKRLRRIEKSGLTDVPAYQSWKQNGAINFSAKNKNYNELQKEYWRIKNFLNSKTSTVRGTNNYLKEIASNTGIKYKNMKDLQNKTKDFFDLTDRIQNYYKSINKNAIAIDYQRIWNQINTSIKQGLIDFDSNEDLLEQYKKATKTLDELEEKEQEVKINNWQYIDF